MAHTKSQKAASGNRDSRSKRLGIKRYGGQPVNEGGIIIRQRGTKVHPGDNTFLGRDFTIHARIAGTVYFKIRHGETYACVK